MRVCPVVFVCLALVGGFGCDDDDEGVTIDAESIVPADGGVDASLSATVSILDDRFQPTTITVKQGGTVRWTNDGDVDHTVTSGASSNVADNPGADFDTTLSPGETFDETFQALGSHPYFCRFHENLGMKGTVNVVP